ncbi:lysophosphatidylcholine acyltransferase 1-like [Cricetulus griseus]|uniref:lysophosphatidylcholine acyltransferase 1-like n=1 Tax=Cricetulus griseus TaxID=10029 RepID=UPI00045412F6|nr:lysophosphatidylcholine acyltransferase 1-like [Cricetulus griseus]
MRVTRVTLHCPWQMYGSPEDGSIDEISLSCILKTALGVSELTVTDLFQAIDQEEKGRITFDDFCRFAEMYPDFAEDYLYPDQTHFDNCAQTPPAPTPNGFCIDFSPENSDFGRKNFCKKVD